MRSESVSAGTVSFRPMTAESAEHLGEALAVIDPWAHYDYTPEMLSEFLSAKEEDAPRFEIVSDEALAGAISVRRTWLRGPYLQFLAILPAFQKCGIGGAALSWFEARARHDKARNIWVVASDFNRDALAFYERFGFVQVANLDGLVAEGVGEILLRKRLLTR
ncbi:MAG: GNAT family N-acetyltransferase [Proteobacteria bacterium]|nr:GNAT family N-acetyltransferase [Pseudomonadota bacterium]